MIAADGEEGRPAANDLTIPNTRPPLADPFLALAADVLDDLESVRIANENRLRQLTRTGPDDDGIERGFGLDLTHPAAAQLAAVVRTFKCDSKVIVELTGEKTPKRRGCCLEHDAEKGLAGNLRRNPLAGWAAARPGVGEKQFARLLASIGDPYIRPEMTRRSGDGETTEPSRPRMVSELWAFAGLHVIQTPVSGHEVGDIHKLTAGVAPKRTRGQRANWSGAAKMRAYLVAESCIKQAQSPYRPVYDKGRERHADAVHEVPCARCGPKGKPAQPGTPLSAGHQHGRAMRLVMKEILRDLWTEAKRLHQEADHLETDKEHT